MNRLVGLLVLLLCFWWGLTACEQIQTIADWDMRPFPVPFIK